MGSEAQLGQIDELMDAAVEAVRDYLVTTITADIRREWKDALTAAADFAALAVDTEPSEEDTNTVAEATKRAAFLAALFMLLYLGLRDDNALAVSLRLSRPGSIASASITERLRSLRQIINQRVVAAFGLALQSGASRAEALEKAIRQAENSIRIFAEAEALSAVNAGIGSTGDFFAGQGIVVTKTWRTRRDNRVREPHIRAEGQEVPQSAFFNVGGWPMEFPGDRRAPVDLWANCRCIAVLGSPSPLGEFSA
jgi:hypothetical protein